MKKNKITSHSYICFAVRADCLPVGKDIWTDGGWKKVATINFDGTPYASPETTDVEVIFENGKWELFNGDDLILVRS